MLQQVSMAEDNPHYNRECTSNNPLVVNSSINNKNYAFTLSINKNKTAHDTPPPLYQVNFHTVAL